MDEKKIKKDAYTNIVSGGCIGSCLIVLILLVVIVAVFIKAAIWLFTLIP